MKPDRALVAEWYSRGAVIEAPSPVSGITDSYYRVKLQSGLIIRSADYTADWTVEDDEYSVTPERYGAGDTRVIYLADLRPEEDGVFDPEAYELDEYTDDPDDFVSSVAEIARLTRRERQVILWIAEGNSLTGSYAIRLAEALGIGSPSTIRTHVENALNKLREHWANDMEAQGLVDPRYLEPIRINEFECTSCHLIYNNSLRTESGECAECTT